MQLTHVNITMPPGQEAAARAFYGHLLGLTEIPKPESIRHRGGVWFNAGGLHIHISAEPGKTDTDTQRHFGLSCDDVAALQNKLESKGFPIDPGRPVPWKRFFVRDPFGNRIEIHEPGGLG